MNFWAGWSLGRFPGPNGRRRSRCVKKSALPKVEVPRTRSGPSIADPPAALANRFAPTKIVKFTLTARVRIISERVSAKWGPARTVFCWPSSTGVGVPPALGLARSLVGRGHQVHVLADPTVAADAETAGCAFSPWREAPHFRSRAEQTAVVAAFESRRPYRAIKAVRDFAGSRMAGRYAPRCGLHGAGSGCGCRPRGGRPARDCHWRSVHRAPHRRLDTQHLPAADPRIPPHGDRLVTRPRTAGTGARLACSTAARWLLDRTLPRVNPVLSGYGRTPLTEFFGLFDRCDRVLVMTSPSFDFTVPQLPDNVRYVGPQLDDPDWAAPGLPWRRLGTEPLVLGATSSICTKIRSTCSGG